MNTIKLYTEEEVIRAIELSDGRSTDEVLARLTPIELPSDEEIEKIVEQEYKKHPNNKYLYDHSDELKLAYKAGCWDGIKWMEEQIINQTKDL